MENKKSLRLENIKQIRAMSDPYRQEIMSHISLIGRPATAKEIAVSMKEAPSKVNYHLKVLEKYNLVKIDHTENINGIIAKYYMLSANQYSFIDKNGDRTKEKDAAFINMIENMYNNSKQNYINKVMIALDSENDEDKGQLASGKFYLSKADIEEINSLFDKLSKQDKAGKKVYSVFMSIISDN